MLKQPSVQPSFRPSVQPSSKPSGAPSISMQPSFQPSITCDASLRNVLLGLSGKSALYDDTSPQGKALQWICNDSFSLSLIGNDDNRIIQRYALAVVYYSTDGDDWRNNNRWLVDGVVGNECGWYGVTCKLGIVTKLSMINNNLDGAIPVEIASLTELCKFLTFETWFAFIELFFVVLTLSFSPFNIDSAAILQLGYNTLSGRIPTELGSLTNLVNVWLNDNQLSGQIPSEFGNLTQLGKSMGI